MTNKVKKPHTIKVAGVSCLNGQYKLNVSGRINPLQLFQVAIPGKTTFSFVTLPRVMTKRDAVMHLIEHKMSDDPEILSFLKGLLRKYDAKYNKVPGKRGRPAGSKNKPKAHKAVAVKEIKAMIEPVEATPVKSVVSDAEKQKIMEDNREKLRKVARQMKQAKVA